MVRLGNFFFHYRNFLFPVFYISLFIPSPPVFADYRLSVMLGIVVALSGQGLRALTIGLAYIVRGGKNRRVYAEDLVTEGIFAHCRNPLYVGNILMLLGMGLIANSLYYVLIMFPLFVFIYQAIVMAEENFLRNKFGEAYVQYTRDVNRWFPNLKGLGRTLKGMEFKWKRVLLKEYNTTFYWLIGAALLISIKTGAIESMTSFMPVLLAIIFVFLIYLYVKFLKKTKRLTTD